MDFLPPSLQAGAALAQWCLPLLCAGAGQVMLRKGVAAGWLCIALGGALFGLYTDTPGLMMWSLWAGSFTFMVHWLNALLLQERSEQPEELRRWRE